MKYINIKQTNENLEQTNRQNREVRESIKKPCLGKSMTTPPPSPPTSHQKSWLFKAKNRFSKTHSVS